MARALLLSPDDQAVSAITGVLEEMSVTCERPLDGATAAQKLNSNNFDLVLVDCENLPAAKLIFDVCRRGKDGHNPVPIAIVDGRAGLPTAFRLGAELILTKPVAKDQARATIRTAVSRVRKTSTNDASTTQWMATTSTLANLPPAATTPADEIAAHEHRAVAATAGVASASSASAAPAPASALMAEAALNAPVTPAKLSSPLSVPQMSSAVQETDAPIAPPEVKHPATFVSGSTVPRVPSDDPVLAELERQELGETAPVGEPSAAVESAKSGESAKKGSVKEDSSKKESRHEKNDHAPSFYVEKKQPRGALVVSLVFAVLGAGMYLAWMYQPGFRPLVEPQLNRVLALAGLPPIESPVTAHPVQPATKPAAPENANNSAAPDSTADDSSAASSAPGPTTPSANANAPAAATSNPAPAKTVSQTAVSPATSSAAPAQTKADATTNDAKSAAKPVDSKSAPATAPASAAATPSTTPLPEESSTLILSSKGAQNRLEYSIQPQYPAEAHAGPAEATVVLKVIVTDNGKVQGVRLVEGNPVLATAAIRAVKQWRYRPFVRDGKNLAFQTVVMVDFQKP